MGNVIFTIGYGGRSAGELLEDLRVYEITHLIDVRSHPQSNWYPEFSAGLLTVWLPREGIEYIWLGDSLGGKVDPEVKNDPKLYRSRPSFRPGFERVTGLITDGHVPVLMCAERRPAACHRSKLLAPAFEAAGFSVVHILEDGQPVDHADLPATPEVRKLF